MISSVSSPTLYQPFSSRGTEAAQKDQPRAGQASPETSAAGKSSGGVVSDVTFLSEAAQREVQQLRRVDQSVRQHEAAHKAAGGGLAGGISLSTTRGPDGRNYAVGGEVPIDISAESSPAATIAKMEKVKAAALAPADPSPQDRRVAQQADSQKVEARKELQQQNGAGFLEGTEAANGGAKAEGDEEEAPSDSNKDKSEEAGWVAMAGKDHVTKDQARTDRAISAYGAAGAIFTPRSNGPALWV